MFLFVLEVNAGPLEIANTFLGEKASQYPGEIDNIKKLTTSLKEFLKVCNFALKLNKTIIGGDQLAFQAECENGFAQLSNQLDALFKKTPGV
jgi:hypothetical protein